MKPYYITITSFFPTPNYSREFFVYEPVKTIQKEGYYEMVVLKPKKWYSSENDYEYEGVKVYRFNFFELPSNILPGLFNFVTIWFLHKKLKSIGIRVEDVAVVHAHVNCLGFLATALKKKKFFSK